MSERQPVKNAKRIRWIVAIIEILVLMAMGALPVLIIGRSGVASLVVTLALVMAVIGVFALIRQRYPEIFAKQVSEKPVEVSKSRKALTTMLQAAAGFCIAFGLISLIVAVIQGYEGSYALYIGSILLGVAIIILLSTVPAVQDPELRQEMDTVKKDMKYYDKDERYIAITHKAGHYTLWTALSLLLIFGAALAVFEVRDIGVAVWGILGICISVFVLWIVLFTIYDGDKDNAKKPRGDGMRSSIITFVVSLLPVSLMAARWVLHDLNSMGRAFFFVFVFVSLACLADIVMKARLARKR